MLFKVAVAGGCRGWCDIQLAPGSTTVVIFAVIDILRHFPSINILLGRVRNLMQHDPQLEFRIN